MLSHLRSFISRHFFISKEIKTKRLEEEKAKNEQIYGWQLGGPTFTREPDLVSQILKEFSVGVPITVKDNIVDIKLTIPVCAPVGQRIALSRRAEGKWHLIGYGIIE